MNERIKRLVTFLTKENLLGWQTFNTRNIAGDPMRTIYREDGIIVDICYYWGYLEIFGLTEEEYQSLEPYLGIE